MELDIPWQEIKINSWQQFNKQIENMGDHKWFFRGHWDSDWELRTSLDRLFDDHQSIIKSSKGRRRTFAKREHENLLIQAFKRSAYLYLDHTHEISNDLEWLALMQHFGAPTRLLDVTLSPYIAVFFALESGSGDCCVYAFNHQEIKISNKQVLGKETYREQQDLVFTDSEERFIVVFEPQSNNVRSLAQQGLFLVPSRIEQPFQNLLHEYLQFTDNDICLKFVIPARLRFEGFEILKRMNITSATLFPGIDGFCKSLRYQVLETTQSQKLLE